MYPSLLASSRLLFAIGQHPPSRELTPPAYTLIVLSGPF